LGVALVLIAARIYVSIRITHIFDWADITILIATVRLPVASFFLNLSGKQKKQKKAKRRKNQERLNAVENVMRNITN
jgi:hypothetical protein